MKFLKILFIFFIILAVAVGGIIATDYFSDGFDIGVFDNADMQESTYEITESYAKLSVVAMVADVEIIVNDASATKIETKTREGLGFAYEKDGDTLRIFQKDERKWYQKTGIFAKHNTLKIYLSNDFSGDIGIKNDTGDITASGITANNLKIEGETGDIKITDLVSQNFELETETGNITIENINALKVDVSGETGDISLNNLNCQNLEVENETGCVSLNAVAVEGSVNLENETGDIDINGLYATNINIKNDTGNVNFTDFDGKDIKIETDTGDVTGKINTPKLYEAHTSTGEVSVPRSEPVDSRCYVRTHTGDITIE